MQTQKEKEDEILYESTTPQIAEYAVTEHDDSTVRVHILVDDGLNREHYASEPLDSVEATRLTRQIERGDNVQRTIREDQKHFELDIRPRKTALFTQLDTEFPERNPVRDRFYTQGESLDAEITDIKRDGSKVTLTAVPIEQEVSYQFTLSPEEYKQLLNAKNADTGEYIIVQLTYNKSAHETSTFTIENNNGIILTDDFTKSWAYPLTNYRLSFFNSVVASGLVYMYVYWFVATTSLLYLSIALLIAFVVISHWGLSQVLLRNKKEKVGNIL